MCRNTSEAAVTDNQTGTFARMHERTANEQSEIAKFNVGPDCS